MVEPPPERRDVTDLKFTLYTTLEVSPKQNELNVQNPVKLVTTASKYGMIFIGTNTGIQCINAADIPQHDGRSAKHVTSYKRRDFPLGTQPSHLDVSCDHELLAVTLLSGGCSVLQVYFVQSFGSVEIKKLNEVRLSTTPGVHVSDLQWNPGVPGMIAVVMSDGSAAVIEFKDGKFSLNSIPPQAQASCLCWSPKGKQVVIGAKNGSIVQYKPELKAVKTCNPPKLPQGPAALSVISVHWLSNTQFIAAYKDPTDPAARSHVVIINTPKNEQPRYIYYEDFLFESLTSRPEHYFIHQQQWHMLFSGASNSMDAMVLKMEGDQWTQWMQEDGSRAELPLTQDHKDVHNIGIAMEYSSTKPIPIGENQQVGPMPLLLMYAHNGVLCIFHVLNLLPDAPPVCNAPHPLSDTSGLHLFVSSQDGGSALASKEDNSQPKGKGDAVISQQNLGANVQQNLGASVQQNLGVSGQQNLPHSGLQSFSFASSGQQKIASTGAQILPSSGVSNFATSGLQNLATTGLQNLAASSQQNLVTTGQQKFTTSGQQIIPATGQAPAFAGQVSIQQYLPQQTSGVVTVGFQNQFTSQPAQPFSSLGQSLSAQGGSQTTNSGFPTMSMAPPSSVSAKQPSVSASQFSFAQPSSKQSAPAQWPTPGLQTQKQQQQLPQLSQPTQPEASEIGSGVVNEPKPPLEQEPNVNLEHSKAPLSTPAKEVVQQTAEVEEIDVARENEMVIQRIEELLTEFNSEMEGARTSIRKYMSQAEQNLQNNNLKDKVINDIESLRNFENRFKDSRIPDLASVNALGNNLMEMFGWYEKIKAREKMTKSAGYIELMESQDLDPVTKHYLKNIDRHVYYLETQIKQAKNKLGTLWDNLESTMDIPALEAIYQSLVAHHNILAANKIIIDNLEAALKKINKRHIFKSSKKKIGEQELSTLADRLLDTKLSDSDVTLDTSLKDVSNNYIVLATEAGKKLLNEEKMAAFYDWHKNHKVIKTKVSKNSGSLSINMGRDQTFLDEISPSKQSTPFVSRNIEKNIPIASLPRKNLFSLVPEDDANKNRLNESEENNLPNNAKSNGVNKLEGLDNKQSSNSVSVTSTKDNDRIPTAAFFKGEPAKEAPKTSINISTAWGSQTPVFSSNPPSFVKPSQASDKVPSPAAPASAVSKPVFNIVPQNLGVSSTKTSIFGGNIIQKGSNDSDKEATPSSVSALSSTPVNTSSWQASTKVVLPAASTTSVPSGVTVSVTSTGAVTHGLFQASSPVSQQKFPVTTASSPVINPLSTPSTVSSVQSSPTGNTFAKTTSPSWISSQPNAATSQSNLIFGGLSKTATSSPNTTTPSTTTSLPVSTATTASSIFGAQNVKATTAQFVFGKSTTVSSSSPLSTVNFGNQPSTTAASFTFGGAGTASPLVASTSSASVPSVSVGTSSSNTSGTLVSLLKSPSTTTTTVSSAAVSSSPVINIFGGTTANSKTPMTFGTAGSAATTTSSLVFGSSAISTTAAAAATTTTVSTPSSDASTTTATTAAVPALGSAAAPVTASSSPFSTPIFGSSGATPTIFGGTSTFGGSVKTTSIFGGGTNTPVTSSVFGSPASTTSSIFGSTTLTFGSSTTPSTTAGAEPSTVSIAGLPSSTSITITTSSNQTTTSTTTSTTTPATTVASIFGAANLAKSSATSAVPATTASSTTSGFAGVTTPSVFGGSNTSSPVFGGLKSPTTSAQPFFNTSTASGGASTTSAPSIFAAAPQNPTFGSPSFGTAATTSSFFGNTSSFATTSPNTTFGSTNESGSVFGAANALSSASFFNTAQTATTQPFGNQSAASIFGGSSSFGTPTTTSASSFFGKTICSPTPTTNVFGSSNVFGQTATTTTASLFSGNSFQQKTPFGQTGSLFGQTAPSGGTGTFGTSGGSIFGGSATFSNAVNQQTNIFQAGNTSSPGLFSKAASSGGPFSTPQSGQPAFGAAPAFQSPQKPFGGASAAPLFGSTPSFGSPPAFGGSPTFNTSPNKVFGGTAAPAPAFGSPTQQSSTFENLAQAETVSFGNLAQQQPFQNNTFAGSSFNSWR